MEIFFLDVGQGTCQVIMLGQRRAIVIDCGLRNDKLVLQFLQRSGIEFLERLIVSHSHGDHIGGAVSIMGGVPRSSWPVLLRSGPSFPAKCFWESPEGSVREWTHNERPNAPTGGRGRSSGRVEG